MGLTPWHTLYQCNTLLSEFQTFQAGKWGEERSERRSRPLCVLERLGREKKRSARGTMGRRKRGTTHPFLLIPSTARYYSYSYSYSSYYYYYYYYYYYCYYYYYYYYYYFYFGIPSGSLYGGAEKAEFEVQSRSYIVSYPVYTILRMSYNFLSVSSLTRSFPLGTRHGSPRWGLTVRS